MIVLISILLASTLIVSWLRVIRPFRLRVEGAAFLTVRMPLLARMRMHAMPGTLKVIFAVVLVVINGAPTWTVAIPLFSFAALIALPLKYTLTTVGIRVGWTPFRRWTEFAGVVRASGGARLQGVHGSRSCRIWLSGSRGDDEFLQLLRESIRDGYKGDQRADIVPFPAASQDRSVISI